MWCWWCHTPHSIISIKAPQMPERTRCERYHQCAPSEMTNRMTTGAASKPSTSADHHRHHHLSCRRTTHDRRSATKSHLVAHQIPYVLAKYNNIIILNPRSTRRIVECKTPWHLLCPPSFGATAATGSCFQCSLACTRIQLSLRHFGCGISLFVDSRRTRARAHTLSDTQTRIKPPIQVVSSFTEQYYNSLLLLLLHAATHETVPPEPYSISTRAPSHHSVVCRALAESRI